MSSRHESLQPNPITEYHTVLNELVSSPYPQGLTVGNTSFFIEATLRYGVLAVMHTHGEYEAYIQTLPSALPINSPPVRHSFYSDFNNPDQKMSHYYESKDTTLPFDFLIYEKINRAVADMRRDIYAFLPREELPTDEDDAQHDHHEPKEDLYLYLELNPEDVREALLRARSDMEKNLRKEH